MNWLPKNDKVQLSLIRANINKDQNSDHMPVADPEIFISGGPLTDLRGGPLQSRFSDSLYKQPNFFPKRGGPGPLGPPLNPPLKSTPIPISHVCIYLLTKCLQNIRKIEQLGGSHHCPVLFVLKF